jgi:transposase
MSKTLKLEIKETAEELRDLLKKETNAQIKEKLHALYLLKSGLVTTLGGLSEFLVRDRATIYRWFEKYKKSGLTGLLKLYKPAGRSLSIPPAALEKLTSKLAEPEGFKSYGEIQLWLKSECGVEVDYHAVYRTVRYKLKAKLKVPRPSSIKKDDEESELFKTNLPNLINLAFTLWSWREGEFRPPMKVRYWCQDEARLGLKTITGRQITLTGVKPVGKVQWIRKAFYLYGLFEPASGESFFYEFSTVDTDCFQIFLNLFAEQYTDSLNIIHLDQGGFHYCDKLEIPKNVILLFQPAHSPELNPAERVWEYIRAELRWLNFNNLNQLRNKLDEILKKMTQQVIASLSGWDYILNALNLADI